MTHYENPVSEIKTHITLTHSSNLLRYWCKLALVTGQKNVHCAPQDRFSDVRSFYDERFCGRKEGNRQES